MRNSLKKQVNGIHSLLGSGKSKAKTIDGGVHPVDQAIARLERARAQLEHYRQEHAETIVEYEKLRQEVSEAMDNAKVLYGQHWDQLGASYHGFTCTLRRSVDANMLVEIMPDAIAVVKFTLSVDDLDSLVLSGVIDQKVADKVIQSKPSISGPKA